MKIFKLIIPALLLIMTGSNVANAQSLQDLLGKLAGKTGQAADSTSNAGSSSSGSGLGGTLTNILEGVFSSSNLSVSDLQGNWTSSGPAVCFQGDGFLQKAGGVAAAATIESKLDPYFKQYGLTGSTLSIDSEGNFTLTIKKVKLSGTITPDADGEKGVFNFNFKALGKVSLGSMKTYVTKTSSSMDVMFDATKLMKLITAVGNLTKIQTVQTLSTLLNSYDGLCVGFKLSK